MKITGWIVANTSSCGFRRMLSRLRQAIVSASPTTRGRATFGASAAAVPGAVVTAVISPSSSSSAAGRHGLVPVLAASSAT